MKTYAVITTYVENAVERRAPYREAHLAYLRSLKDAGTLVMAGAFADPIDGALLVYRADNKDDVAAIVENDPYMKNRIWPKVTIREWNVVIS
ncbi:MAG: YciI family protein [Chloroflexi bacterium]|nr:YciI family protein [Chloroflexota bacterium]